MADGGEITVRRQRPVRAADLFCGAGGLSNGLVRALRELQRPLELVGVNHWPIAIETNRRNHPEHAHRIACADLETALPRDHVPGGVLDLLLAAPSCVFHSRARGGRPVHDQQRMDPWHVVRWCTELRVSRILVENVPEFVEWGPCSKTTSRPMKSRRGEYFRAWCAALQAIGFRRVEWRVLNCADYGDVTTRKRFFLVGIADDGPFCWPDQTHDKHGRADLLGHRPKWRGAREVIDWTRPGASIFRRKKPLKPNTIRRILAGAIKYRWPQPYLDALQALLNGTTPRLEFTRAEAVVLGLIAEELHDGFTLSTASGGAARDVAEPLPTITTGGAGGARPGCARPAVIEPLLVMRTNSDGGRTARPVHEPMPTICTAGGGFLAEPLVVPVSNSSSAGTPRGVDEPIRTVTTAKGGDQAIAVPLVAPYYGGGSGLSATSVAEPVPSVTTKARFGLASPAVDDADPVSIDVLYRMLFWRELSRASSFDDEGEIYDFAGNATEITKQIGNAVPNRTAKALSRALLEGLR